MAVALVDNKPELNIQPQVAGKFIEVAGKVAEQWNRVKDILNKIPNKAKGSRRFGGAAVAAIIATASGAVPALADVSFSNPNCSLRGDAGTIYLAIPGIVGPCTMEPVVIDSNGDTEQRTTGGDLFTINGRVAFTNGNTTWEVIPQPFPGAGGVASRLNSQLFQWEQPAPTVLVNPTLPAGTVFVSGVPNTPNSGVITNVSATGGSSTVNINIH